MTRLFTRLAAVAVTLSALAMPMAGHAATLDILGSRGPLAVGQDYSVDVRVNSESQGVNTVQSVIRFNKDVLQVKSVSKAGSVFDQWFQEPKFDNAAGTVVFIGGSKDGLSGKSLQILRVNFTVKGGGNTRVSFDGSFITGNNDNDTNVLTLATGLDAAAAGGTVVPDTAPPIITRPAEIVKSLPAKPAVTVPLYPNAEAWSGAHSEFVARWSLPNDVSGVSAVVSRNPDTNPTESEGLYDNKTFPALEDGIWYLHVRFKNNVGWGEASHYRIAVDTTPPSGMKVVNGSGDSSEDPRFRISAEAVDALSGIEGYYLKVDGGPESKLAAKDAVTDPLPPGKHSLTVIARDNAQNDVRSELKIEVVPLAPPSITNVRRDLFAGEGGIPVSGSGPAGTVAVVKVMNDRGATVYETHSTVLDNGTWSLSIEDPLAKGDYRVAAYIRDERGAVSTPSATVPVHVGERPFATVFGFALQYRHAVYALGVIAILVFLIALSLHVVRHGKRVRKYRAAEEDLEKESALLEHEIGEAIALHAAQGRKGGKRKTAAVRNAEEAALDKKLLQIAEEVEREKSRLRKDIEEIE